MTLRRFGYYRFVKRLSMVRLLNYIRYDKERARETLMNELDWQDYGPKHFESIFTRFFQAYILPRKFGIDKRKAHFSTLIMSGQMDRHTALAELAKPPYPSQELEDADKKEVLRRLGLSEGEFEALIRQQPKSYRDYPSTAWLFDAKNGLAKLGLHLRGERQLAG